MDIIEQSGILALGSRLQQINELLRKEAALFYKSRDIEFEPKWFPIIYILSVEPYLGVVELSKEIGLTHPTTIGLLKELEEEGLIRSLKDKEDERKRNVSLTDKARTLIKTMQPLWTAMAKALVQLTSTPNNLLSAISETNEKVKEKSFFNRMNEMMEVQKGDSSHKDRVVKVNKVSGADELKMVLAIRKEVFVREQNVPPEFEARNDEDAVHYLATVNDLPAGTARYRKTDSGIKLERFAVLKYYRGMQVGDTLVKTILNDLPAYLPVYLYAQVDIAGLYVRNGFRQVGDEFEEATIKHIKMVLAEADNS
jgi:predicted GNAT family N-acyltransferase/DNA-binding MarR family transcriptional regulator